ncbi:hypothetical protein AK812_SmicGene46321, partial [Symbiodinium microadriaticum]
MVGTGIFRQNEALLWLRWIRARTPTRFSRCSLGSTFRICIATTDVQFQEGVLRSMIYIWHPVPCHGFRT